MSTSLRRLRSSATRSNASRLTSQQSTFSSSVTLYELDESKARAASPRVRDNVDDTDMEDSAPPKKRVKRESNSTNKKSKQPNHPQSPPSNWRQVYDLISEMRYSPTGSAHDAPVDTMGCDIAGEGEQDKNKRFSIFISLMLSSQTKDNVTHTAIGNLRSALGGSLSASALASASSSVIRESINKVGFWQRKSEYIHAAAIRCRDSYDGDVPNTLEELLAFKGVGKKMAYLTLQSGWGLNLGIGVDVHVHRISNRLGWHKPPTKTPEETRVSLESWLPLELHPKINHLLVGFGQTICTPVKPKCSECTLGKIEGLCPSVQLSSPSSSPRKSKGKAKTTTTTKQKKNTTIASSSVSPVEFSHEIKRESTEMISMNQVENEETKEVKIESMAIVTEDVDYHSKDGSGRLSGEPSLKIEFEEDVKPTLAP